MNFRGALTDIWESAGTFSLNDVSMRAEYMLIELFEKRQKTLEDL